MGRFSRLAACTILAVNEQLVKHWKADNCQMCGWHLKMKDITMDYGLWTIDIYRLHMITYFFWAALIIEKVYTDECEAKADSMFVLAPASWVCPQRTSLHGRPAPSLFHPFSVRLMDTHTNKQSPQKTIANTRPSEVILKSLCSHPLSAFFDCLAFRFSLSDITEIRGPQPVSKLYACDSTHISGTMPLQM